MKIPKLLRPPLSGTILRRIEIWDDYGEVEEVRPEAASVNDATVITSEVKHPRPELPNAHKVALDIDLPIKVIESSTPGHGHLYIDHEMSWENYVKLMEVMVEVGLLERGYLGASLQRGFTSLRLPWIKKGDESTTINGFSIRCAKCHRTPSEIPEYVAMAQEEGYEKMGGAPDAEMAVLKNEGTYNSDTGKFWCTECYIKLGQPLGKPGKSLGL